MFPSCGEGFCPWETIALHSEGQRGLSWMCGHHLCCPLPPLQSTSLLGPLDTLLQS